MAGVVEYMLMGEETKILLENRDEVLIRDDDATWLVFSQLSGKPCWAGAAEARHGKRPCGGKLIKESFDNH